MLGTQSDRDSLYTKYSLYHFEYLHLLNHVNKTSCHIVYLHIKRRRWTNKANGEIIKRDWTLVAKGTRMTQEFAAFLKEINR